jgi:tetracycline 7-halogenase / FADH2 O2-dependent halogenase
MIGEYDIAIIGSGFAGSLLAMIARRLGHKVMLIEKGKHPRIVIGESSTPLSNLLLEELTSRYDLPNLKSLVKWGTWQKKHPEVGCGLKRGFTFYHHDLDRPTLELPDRSEQLLVAASPHDEIGDTHWYRADFDQLFVLEAQNLGVIYLDETQLDAATELDEGIELSGLRRGEVIKIIASFVVDASGPHGFLHRALGLTERELPGFPNTQSIYSHFSGVKRLGDRIPASEEQPPFPVDDAAVHHVFDGGWVWVLQFNNGMTSAGIAATDKYAERMQFAEGAEAWARLMDSIPILRQQFADAKAERPFTRIQRLSFRSGSIAGRHWALLPSAAGFVDPLLSTGFPLTLLGVVRLAEIIEADWNLARMQERLRSYAVQTDSELIATSRLIGSLYSNMNNFPVFIALTLLYFAAATFSETARRLGKPSLAGSFLLSRNPVFGPAFIELCDRARRPQSSKQSRELIDDILKAIEPFNIAGLGNPDRQNWYPVEASDMVSGAGKVQSSTTEIKELLDRCGFWAKST